MQAALKGKELGCNEVIVIIATMSHWAGVSFLPHAAQRTEQDGAV